MPEPAEDYAAMTDAELSAAWNALGDGDSTCATRLPIYRAFFERRRPDPAAEAEIVRMELACDHERGDSSGALERMKNFERKGGVLSYPLPLIVAANAGDKGELLGRMEVAVLDSGNEAYASLDPDLWFYALRQAADLGLDSELDEMAAVVLRSEGYRAFRPVLQHSFAARALLHGLAIDDDELLSHALEEITSPRYFNEYLANRKYQAIWPLVERRAGEGMVTVLEDHLKRARAEFVDQPDDPQQLSNMGHALYYSGRFEELLAFADAQLGRDNLAETLVEEEGWLLNLKAYTLDALGRTDEADAVFEFLAEPAKERGGWGVNFVINRASRLVGQHRWEEGLAAANEAQQVSDKHGSTYAKLIVAKDQLCALTALGRADDAKEQLAFIRENSSASAELAVGALLCQDRDEEAVTLLLAALDDEDSRRSLITDLQPVQTDLFYTPSKHRRAFSLLAEHPALKAKFEQFAREIPERFFTPSSITRHER